MFVGCGKGVLDEGVRKEFICVESHSAFDTGECEFLVGVEVVRTEG